MKIKASLNWTNGMQFIGRAGESPAIVLDDLAGGSGAAPMSLVLMGVAGCTAMDVVSIMRKKRVPFKDFQVNVSGDRAENHPKRYTNIHIEFLVWGDGIRPRDVEQAIKLSSKKYCGASASLNATIQTSYRIIEDRA